MRQTLNGMRKRGSEDRGFTMIELLVVVVIIGVLVAIAVPVYLNYRKGAANKSAQSDVRGAITAVEQFYTDNGNQYPDDVLDRTEGQDLELAAIDGSAQTIKVSPGNVLRFVNTSGTGTTSYKICGRNTDGEQTYVYDSDTGGSVSQFDGTLQECVDAP
jgi:type IV pilus assembly protein PilA